MSMDSILGPHVIGVMVAIFLFGLVTIQAFTYYKNYPKDSRWIKLLVRPLLYFRFKGSNMSLRWPSSGVLRSLERLIHKTHGSLLYRVLLFAHTIISCFSIYRRVVSKFGQTGDLANYPEAMCGAFSLSGIIGATIQVSHAPLCRSEVQLNGSTLNLNSRSLHTDSGGSQAG